jgi:outer membrane receptor protein involved in Fe transport
MKPLLMISVLAILLISFSAFQLQASEPQGKISGNIMTETTNEPVSFANICLKNKEKQVVTGCTSNSDGQFNLSVPNYGNYELEITCLGYKPQQKQIQINQQNESISLGVITLEKAAEQLAEVKVEEARLKGKQEVDRTVFTINETSQKSATDGMDILRHIPGVSVDFQGNVNIEGSGNILYLVNGVKRDKNFVAQLHPDDFNKVEIMTNPGVKYDADIDAVINIVTKAHRTGGRGGISLQGSSPKSFIGNENANLEYGNEKFRVFVKDRFHLERFPAASYVSTEITEGAETTSLIEEGTGNASWLNNNLNYGFDWFINDKNVINLYGEHFTHRSNNSDYQYNGIQALNDSVISSYDMNLNKTEDKSRLFNSLFYKHLFDQNKQFFTIQINHYQYHGQFHNAYNYTLLNQPENPEYSSRIENIDNHKQMLEWKNDYSQEFENVKLDLGAWSYYQWFDNNYVLNSEIETDFTYREFRQDIYLSAAGALKKLRYSGGLRVAYSNSDINEQATNQYTEFLPQLSLQYPINKTSSLKLSGRRRITRPTIDQLNPFNTQANTLEMRRGNPNLKPELLNRVELQYALNFGSNYISPKLYLDYSTNSIQHNIHFTDEGISILQPENVGERYEYGFSLSGALVLGKLLRFAPSVSIFNAQVAGPGGYTDEMLSFRTNSSLMITPFKSKDYSFLATFRYQTARLQFKSIIRRDPLFFFGMSGKITENFKATAYIAPTMGGFTYHEVEISDDGYKMLSSNSIDSHCFFTINFVYQFSWGKTPRKLQRETDYERDGSGGTL